MEDGSVIAHYRHRSGQREAIPSPSDAVSLAAVYTPTQQTWGKLTSKKPARLSPEDIALAAVFVSALSFGRVAAFLPVAAAVLDVADAHGGPSATASAGAGSAGGAARGAGSGRRIAIAVQGHVACAAGEA
jgi:hypothetical protein